MISLKNALKLAIKKLKVRRQRTILSVLAASTLFGVAAYFLIFSNIFMDSIFQFHQAYFEDGKVYLTIDYSERDLSEAIVQAGGKASAVSDYNFKYTPDRDTYVVKDFPMVVGISFIEVYEDGQVLERFKLAEPKYEHTIPVFLRDGMAAVLTGVDLTETEELHEKSTNFVFIAEGEKSNLEFEIIGIIPTINHGGENYKTDYYNKFAGYFGGISRQEHPIIRQQDFERTNDLYERSTFSMMNQMAAEFESLDQAAAFIDDNQVCFSFSGCLTSIFGRVTTAQASEIATNRFGIIEFRQNFNNLVFWLSIVLIVVSAIILMGTFSRVFLDEQKSAAIFEAIGATKADVWKIYFIYSLILAIIVAVATQIIGYGGALLLDIFEAPTATAEIIKVFRIVSTDEKLTMVGVYLPALWISVAAFASVMLSFLISARHITAKNIIQKLKD